MSQSASKFHHRHDRYLYLCSLALGKRGGRKEGSREKGKQREREGGSPRTYLQFQHVPLLLNRVGNHCAVRNLSLEIRHPLYCQKLVIIGILARDRLPDSTKIRPFHLPSFLLRFLRPAFLPLLGLCFSLLLFLLSLLLLLLLLLFMLLFLGLGST